GYETLDSPPNYDFYANTEVWGRRRHFRPSLYQLYSNPEDDSRPPMYEETMSEQGERREDSSCDDEDEKNEPPPEPTRFGWIQGVMIRCMLNIWGVILYLRLPWITAQAGIGMTWVIILLSSCITGIRIIGVITVTCLLGISMAGMAWESKAQVLFFVVIMISFASYIIGTIIPATPQKQAKGFFSYKADIFATNFVPNWRGPEGSFFGMFSIFFPSATGILAGANISGDLKNPAMAIPRGTLLAILGTTVSYIIISATIGSCVVRDASGILNDSLSLTTSNENCTGFACHYGWFSDCIYNKSCTYGISNYYQVRKVHSQNHFSGNVFKPVLAQVKIGQTVTKTVCKDKVSKYLSGLGLKGFIKTQRSHTKAKGKIAHIHESMSMVSAYAPLITALFYSLINFSCFHASITNSPGWRPSFKLYNKWLSLLGAVCSVVIMFLLTWWAALIAFGVVFILLGYTLYKKPDVNWGSSVQASSYNIALNQCVGLNHVEDHVKNYRPQCLVLTGAPSSRPALVDLVACFTKINSTVINSIVAPHNSKKPTKTLLLTGRSWLYSSVILSHSKNQIKQLKGNNKALPIVLQGAGLSRLKPNVMLMGFKSDWRSDSPHAAHNYVAILQDAFDLQYGVCILRTKEGLDVSHSSQSHFNAAFDVGRESINTVSTHSSTPTVLVPQPSTVFQKKQGKKTIDVYWLSDDGGLTLLLPYLLTRRRRWARCKVRVFVGGTVEKKETQKEEIVALIKKFRLGFNDVEVLPDIYQSPQPENVQRFENMLSDFRIDTNPKQDAATGLPRQQQQEPWLINDQDLETNKTKSLRQIRLNEVLHDYSRDAALIVITMPVGRRGVCPSTL
uniref:Solute carrier family 12 member 3 n=1 Tax=Tetraodon nigroviridis TaxID=99883 RepID=H3CI37_TETNG